MLRKCNIKELIKHIETYYNICKRYFIRDIEQDVDAYTLMTMQTIENFFTMDNVNLCVLNTYFKTIQECIRNGGYMKLRVADEYISCFDEMIRDINSWIKYQLESALGISLSE